eukprot:TRINITY_DN2382_c0_g2_i1.p1 TRINITY_DN2382_c0_g2~~TRINITY_DN2382_c0_g2_i1.p1  ORF type:complete len:642 (+),score=110.45 TRINITY_DN2382_c0_g2_i1:39-1928(+)
MAASSPSEDGRPAKKLKVTGPADKAEENGGNKAAPQDEAAGKRWLPSGFVRKPTKVHRSTAKWTGPAKVGWSEFFVLDLDPAVIVKQTRPSISSKRRALKQHDRGGKQLDWDASEAEENADANPFEPESTTEEPKGTTVPLTVPTWKNTRAWLGLLQATLDAELWKPSHLVSHVIRTRRKGRSTEGGGADLGNPQEPPSGKVDESANTLLLPIGGTGKAPSRQKVRMVKWRSPSLLVLSPQVIVDPKKYKGLEAAARAQRRNGETDDAADGSKTEGASSPDSAKIPGSSPASPSGSKGSEQYKASMMKLMAKLQAGGTPDATAVRECWASLSAADRVMFSSEFPQFMSIIVGLPSSGSSSPKGESSALVSAPSRGDGKGLPLAAQALSLALSPPASPSELVLRQADLETQQLEAVWADRISFHDSLLRVNMTGLKMSDHMMGRWCKWAPSLLKTLSSAGGAPLSNAEIDFSMNLIEDGGVKKLCNLLKQCDIHVERLNLDGNRLTDGSLVTISEFLDNSRGAVHEVRMEDNTVAGSFGVMHLSRSLNGMRNKYPMYRDDMQRYTPLMLFLGRNSIDQPIAVAQSLRPALGGKLPCLAEDRRFWEKQEECPAVQLPSFEKQKSIPKKPGF